MSGYILAIDQGTTSTRAILFDHHQKVRAESQQEFPQYFPQPGWVEHDGEEIWQSVMATSQTVLRQSGVAPKDIAGIGITNQRETTLLWDKHTGKPIHRAIVWQDRRTAELCENYKAAGEDQTIAAKTGLVLDAYFSATKIKWLLDNVAGARRAAETGQILFGTIDSYLLWQLTGGKVHKTDATNAARTMLYNIHTHKWDADLCQLFDIPPQILPQVEDCNHQFGITLPNIVGGEIPIMGMAGDQHAATLGQACFTPGMMKSTYGTGCFAMMVTGNTPVVSSHRMLTTIAYQLDGQPSYALEGSIFIAGAAVQWLRDGLKIIESASETGPLAAAADPAQGLVMVPAFVGLGAPYWEPAIRGAIFGLTRNSGPREFARAALESVCYQTQDLVGAMLADFKIRPDQLALRVDGGMAASDWTMQFLADTLNCPVDRPTTIETTALGAAWLAGYTSAIWPDQAGFAKQWQREKRFLPKMDGQTRQANIKKWQASVDATLAQSRGARPSA